MRESHTELLLRPFSTLHLANAWIEKSGVRFSPCYFVFTEQWKGLHWSIGYIQIRAFEIDTSNRFVAPMKRIESKFEQQSFILASKCIPVTVIQMYAFFFLDSVVAGTWKRLLPVQLFVKNWRWISWFDQSQYFLMQLMIKWTFLFCKNLSINSQVENFKTQTSEVIKHKIRYI